MQRLFFFFFLFGLCFCGSGQWCNGAALQVCLLAKAGNKEKIISARLKRTGKEHKAPTILKKKKKKKKNSTYATTHQ